MLCREVRWVWIEPRADVLELNRDDAPAMTGKSYFLRRVVCDGRKRQQVRFTLPLRMRPQSCNQHLLRRVGLELKDHVFIFLPLKRHAILKP